MFHLILLFMLGKSIGMGAGFWTLWGVTLSLHVIIWLLKTVKES